MPLNAALCSMRNLVAIILWATAASVLASLAAAPNFIESAGLSVGLDAREAPFLGIMVVWLAAASALLCGRSMGGLRQRALIGAVAVMPWAIVGGPAIPSQSFWSQAYPVFLAALSGLLLFVAHFGAKRATARAAT